MDLGSTEFWHLYQRPKVLYVRPWTHRLAATANTSGTYRMVSGTAWYLSDLLLPRQRGSCEQRPEVRRRRPLLRAQVEAQVCGAERHGLSGVITR
eukprot:scaffold15254_cov73-Phaeocystis_antarctica.AAC.2